MRQRYLGIVAFTLLTGVIVALVFRLLNVWSAGPQDRQVAMLAATAFVLAPIILLFRFLVPGREWDPPADVAFTAVALIMISAMFSWGVWLLLAAIPIGGLVTILRMVRISRTTVPKGELFYLVALLVQFVLILSTLMWLEMW